MASPEGYLSGLELRRDLGADEVDHVGAGLLRREAGRLAVAAAALLTGDQTHVDVVGGGAEADLAHALAALLELRADQRRDDRALDRTDVVDDSLGVVLVGTGLLVVAPLDVGD